MTLSLETSECSPQLRNSIHLMRRVMPAAGFAVPASALGDRSLAAWVRSSGITVIASGEAELDLVQSNGIRPTQVVFRSGAGTDSIRRAVHAGVFRYLVGTQEQIARLNECAQRTKYVYLDAGAPAVLSDRRVQVVGLHSDVDYSGGPAAWATAAERLLSRAALSNAFGSPIHRIILSGGSTDDWVNSPAAQTNSVVRAVDDALRDGCERWWLPRPAVTFAQTR